MTVASKASADHSSTCRAFVNRTERNTCKMSGWFHKSITIEEKILHDEAWEYSEEPHASRRDAILKKHPEIKKLMGPDPRIAYIVTAEVLLQLLICYFLREASWLTVVCLAYCVGATLNHSLGSAIHEIGHNLAFGHKHPLRNRALSMLCNLPIVVPFAITYKRYHSDHHRYLGEEYKDVDIPSRLEIYLFRNPLTKCIWLLLHPLIHGIRPLYKSPKSPSNLEVINSAVQFSFDAVLLSALGPRSFVYLLLGSLLGFGFHPMTGHFISEHYLFDNGNATHSYYGPLNLLLFNVGYHNEHHDFPYIPYTRLPEVKRIAAEFYDDLPCHTSLVRVLWDFVTKPHCGPQARECCVKPKNGNTQENGQRPSKIKTRDNDYMEKIN